MVPTWEEVLEAAGSYGMENLSSSSSQLPQGGESSPSSDTPLPELLGETLEVHIIDVGQGESILIKGPSKNVLIDAGENDKGDEVLAYLKSQGVQSLDMAIGTHAHSDHIGGLDTVIKAMPVKQVILSHVERHSQKPEEARRRIEALMGDVPRIELFARASPPGWDVWGNEVASDIRLAERM